MLVLHKNNYLSWKIEKGEKRRKGDMQIGSFSRKLIHFTRNSAFCNSPKPQHFFRELNQNFGRNFGQPPFLRCRQQQQRRRAIVAVLRSSSSSSRRRKHFHHAIHHPPEATPWSWDPALMSRLFSVCRTGVVLRTRSKRIVRPGLTIGGTR